MADAPTSLSERSVPATSRRLGGNPALRVTPVTYPGVAATMSLACDLMRCEHTRIRTGLTPSRAVGLAPSP